MHSETNRSTMRQTLKWTLISLPYLMAIGVFVYMRVQMDSIPKSSFILINKEDYSLTQYRFDGNIIARYNVALGKNPGNKGKVGDKKTPEGVFRISEVQPSSHWTHDFKDDTLGIIEGAYGPYFIRLDVPNQKGIGIHGTHDPSSIGTRASEGCIRMKNEDIHQLVERIKTVSVVVIVPGKDDIAVPTTDLPAVSGEKQKSKKAEELAPPKKESSVKKHHRKESTPVTPAERGPILKKNE